MNEIILTSLLVNNFTFFTSSSVGANLKFIRKSDSARTFKVAKKLKFMVLGFPSESERNGRTERSAAGAGNRSGARRLALRRPAARAYPHDIDLEMADLLIGRSAQEVGPLQLKVLRCPAVLAAEMRVVLLAQGVDLPVAADIVVERPILFERLQEAVDGRKPDAGVFPGDSPAEGWGVKKGAQAVQFPV